ncbi:helix-turn-helix domain-containing protein [Streptomyces sp. NPDC047002]|uniref:TetR/AcrR family transcriptional regulator n=1 Tax=Streptomyces sp. NPDC047002 TaxID=3155475 RepID=UPI00345545BD
MGKGLRRDAADNRARIVEAAAAAFAERGRAVPMEDIARRAGVAPATLYRRFPTKEALLAELVAGFYAELVALAEEALRLPPAEGLDRLLRTVGHRIAAARGYLPLAWGELAAPEQVGHLRGLTAAVLERAGAAGAVDPRVTVSDVATVVWALRGVIETAGDIAPAAWERHLDFVAAGLRRGPERLSAPALALGDVDRITGP